MKKIPFIILTTLMVTSLYSQSTFNGYSIGNYTVTVNADNNSHTYKYKNNDYNIVLYNINNKYTDIPMRYTDGEEMKGSAAVLPRSFTTKPDDQTNYANLVGYFDKYITEIDGVDTRRNINHNEPVFFTLAVNSATGKVEEVEFSFTTCNGFDEVSPLAYYYIEKAIKENVSFNINSLGKRLNYLPISYAVFLPAK